MRKTFTLMAALLMAAMTFAQPTITARATINVTSATGSADSFTVMEGSDFTNSFDNGYDAAKMMNTGTSAINLYGTQGGTNVSTLATNDLTNTELILEANESDTSYTLSFSNVSGNIRIYDRYANAWILISPNGCYSQTYDYDVESWVTNQTPNGYDFSNLYLPDVGNRFVISYDPQYYIGLEETTTGDITWYPMTKDSTTGTWEYTGAYSGGGAYVNTSAQTSDLMRWVSEDTWVVEGNMPQSGDTVHFTWNPETNIMIVESMSENDPQPQEERRICLTHGKLMITEINNSTPVLLDSAGLQVEMLVEGYPMENAIQYDLRSLAAGRYTLVIDDESLRFDFGTETTTSSAQEGQDCIAYTFVINATMDEGQTYLFNCDRITQPGTYNSILSSSTQCDSIVMLYLSFTQDEIPCSADTTLIQASICQGEAFIWRGEEFNEAGTYDFTVQYHGSSCDSVYRVQITENSTSYVEEIVSVREDRLPYTWHRQVLTETGDYYDTVRYTRAQCDSICYTLHFTVTQLPIYTVEVLADHGFVNGTGTYPEGTQISLTAVPDENFEFQMWSDGSTLNPKNFTVMQDTTFRALFYMPEVEQEVVVDSIETNSVTITWDTVPGATLYELTIYKNGKVIAAFQVDKDNNIVNEHFFGPERIIARRDSTGGSSETLQVNIGGLEPGQDYTYSLDALDDDRSYVGAQSGSFTTEEEPIDGLEQLNTQTKSGKARKLLREGCLYIELPNGTTYDARGQRTL
ncbi:MAG: hypothetical protein IJU36_04075 [Paludibacteraceae bacterium]|nr:hypothetical protein [Paludibacteraceae bacterium]